MHKFKIKKGFFLVFTLLLTVLVTSACLVMVQTATMNKSSSSSQISREKLQNLANQYTTAIARTLDASINASFMSDLVNKNANIFLADLSGGLPPVIVCNVTTSSTAAFSCTANTSIANPKSISTSSGVSSQFLSATQKTLNISPQGTPTANANVMSIDPTLSVKIDVIQNSYYVSGATANYNLTIKTTVCSDPICQDSSTTKNFTRSCPNGGKSLDSKNMRALTDAEIKALSGGQYTDSNTFPNLYCTCSDSGFGRTRNDGTCAVSCTAGQYASGSSCLPCSATAGCATCTTSATNCTSCKPNYIYDSISNTCTCPSGFYKDSSGNCNACNSSCATCSGSATNCTSCSGSYMGLSSGTCSNCNVPGKYFLNSSSPCGTCNQSCATCYGGSVANCTSCSGSYMGLSGGTCSNCNVPGKYFVNSSSPCGTCNSSCATCSGSATNCTSCSGSSMGLSGGNCSNCNVPGKYFVNSSSPCGTCNSSCATCSGGGSNQCLSCYGSMGLSGGTCANCTGSTYFVNNTSPCGNCDPSCATCSGSGSNQCLSCRSGSPINGTCPVCTGNSSTTNTGRPLGNGCYCNNNYYPNNGQCSPCPNGSGTYGPYGDAIHTGTSADNYCNCSGASGVGGYNYWYNCPNKGSYWCAEMGTDAQGYGTLTAPDGSACYSPPSCTGGTVAGGSGQSNGVSNCACPASSPFWYNGSCHYCPSNRPNYQLRCTHTRPDGNLNLQATCNMFGFNPCQEDGLCDGGVQGYYKQIGGCS